MLLDEADHCLGKPRTELDRGFECFPAGCNEIVTNVLLTGGGARCRFSGSCAS